MIVKLRKPALAPPPVVIAEPWSEDPTAVVETYFRQVLTDRMAGLPFINAALEVWSTPFRRIDGDWLGAVVTPWCLQLVLLPGGGSLWVDISAGERRRIRLPAGELEFIADAGESGLPAFQYCPLIAPVDMIADLRVARGAAADALAAATTASESAIDDAEPRVGVDSRSLTRRAFLKGRSGA